ncbi:caspase family protein [Streptomyces libani]
MPEHADRQEIRIRITGTNNPEQDVEDLKAWLEREPWLSRRPHDWELRPAGEPDEGPGDMAIGIDDLILVVVGAAAAEITKSLGIALREWLRRRQGGPRHRRTARRGGRRRGRRTARTRRPGTGCPRDSRSRQPGERGRQHRRGLSRMAEYDARGKVNRALLICVDDYRRLRPLPAVRDNPRELERVLLAPGTDLFTKGEVVICRPQEPWEVEQALDAVTQEARGLLLVYFSGHGRVGPDGGNLQLMVGASERRHKTVSWQDLVLSYLDNARADRIVIVLECCYAGNAGEAFHACRTPTSLLMAAQPNRRIFSGEEPTGGSVFTRALLRTLEQGIPGKRFVTFEDLVRELREQLAGERTPMGDVWEPRSAKQNTVDDVILSFATPEIRPPTPLRIRLRRRLNSRFRHWFRILMVLAIILVPATAGVVLLNLPNDAEACPPALELRLLTAPEAEPALRQAAFDYEMSDANTRPLNGEGDLPDGCRRAQITVYSAAKDQVDQGFAAADRWQGEAHGTGEDGPDDQGIDPLHRPGPQPDIWIPESTADYYAARRGMPAKGSPATLHYSAPVAYTPLVVGIPAHRRLDDVEPAAASWRGSCSPAPTAPTTTSGSCGRARCSPAPGCCTPSASTSPTTARAPPRPARPTSPSPGTPRSGCPPRAASTRAAPNCCVRCAPTRTPPAPSTGRSPRPWCRRSPSPTTTSAAPPAVARPWTPRSRSATGTSPTTPRTSPPWTTR